MGDTMGMSAGYIGGNYDDGGGEFLRAGREREDDRVPMPRRGQPDDFCMCGHTWRDHADVTVGVFEKLCKEIQCDCKDFEFLYGALIPIDLPAYVYNRPLLRSTNLDTLPARVEPVIEGRARRARDDEEV